MVRKPAGTYMAPDGRNIRALNVRLWGRRTMPALGLLACFLSSTVCAENIHSYQRIVHATDTSNVRSTDGHISEQSLNGKDVVTMTAQGMQLLGLTNKEVDGASIVLPRTEVLEFHGYVKIDGEKVVFLHKGENITYLSKVIHTKDKTTGLTHIDFVPGTIGTGIFGTTTATHLPNDGVKIDVTVSDIKLVDMPGCNDAQCPITVGRESRRTVILSPDHAETVDLQLGDNTDLSIRLIFSRQQLPAQVKQTVSGPSGHRA